MNHRNLINSWCVGIKQKINGWNKKTIQRVSYVTIFVIVLTVVATSYINSDTVTQVSLPGVIASDNINVNILQGQKIDQLNQANAVAASVSSTTGGELAGFNTSSAGESSSTSNDVASINTSTTADDVKAANVASSVASVVDLSSSGSVSSSAESVNISAELAQADATSVSKTHIIESSDELKSIATYVAVDGDTAETIASKYGVTSQTIRWANKLKDNNVAVGATITVPTVDGVVYTVKDGDTLASVAEKYQSNIDNIININDLNDEAVAVGTVILLPDGILPETERPEYVAPTPQIVRNTNSATTLRYSYANASAGSRGIRSSLRPAVAAGNKYAYGYCTWYAYNRRAALGMKLPSVTWGNANTWDTGAAAYGYVVNGVPSVGAVFQTDSGYYGHVGIVEEVYADGSIRISEMNYAGWNVVSEGYLTPSDYYGYDFIH